jgi:hypothetical protein
MPHKVFRVWQMTTDLGNGKHITVNAHSEKVWISVYNGTGVVVPLDRAEAMRVAGDIIAAVRRSRKNQNS